MSIERILGTDTGKQAFIKTDNNFQEIVVRLEDKQNKSDNSLLTNDKNIVGAINENKTNIDIVGLSLEQITDNLKNGQYVSPAKYALISLEGIGTSDYCTITILGKTGSNVFQSLCGFSITSGLQQINMGVDLEKAKIVSLNSINYLAVLIPAYSIVHFSPIYSETLAKSKNAVVTYVTDISSYTILKEATKSLVSTTDKIDISSTLAVGWQIYANDWIGFQITKSGGYCNINANIKNTSIINTDVTIANISDVNYKPIKRMPLKLKTYNSSTMYNLAIYPDGTIRTTEQIPIIGGSFYYIDGGYPTV